MLSFQGIAEAKFESIVKRFAIVCIKSRLMDAALLQDYLPDHEKYGIFAREHDLQEWVESGPGQASGLLIQLDFERHCGGEVGRRKTIKSCTHGGDEGVARRVLREACGLAICSTDGSESTNPLLFVMQQCAPIANVGAVHHDRRHLP